MFPGKYRYALYSLLLPVIYLWFVQWRVVTYVCGNDPMYYIRAARTLLWPSEYGPQAVRHALTFVAPGYPVFLAAAIKLFGQLAPYWVNAVLLTAVQPLLYHVMRRTMSSRRAAAFSLASFFLIIFTGHPLHAPFLLYPFRESLRFFLVMFSFSLLLSGFRSGRARPLALLASSFTLLAACVVREPSILILPGLLLAVVTLAPAWPERGRAWACLLLPFIVAGLFALALLVHFDLREFSQFSVMRYLENHAVAFRRASKMLTWFPARAGGWLGLMLIASGIVRAAWKSRVLLTLFLLSSGLFFAFCAYMQMHDRYFLTALLFLVPFAGYGLDGLCTAVEHTLGSSKTRFKQYVRPGLSAAVFIILLVLMAVTVQKMAVWGPAVTAKEVREWQSHIAGLDASASGRIRVAVEQRTRYLEDMLLSYTDADILDPKSMNDWPPDCYPAYYYWPLNGKAIWATPQWLMHLKVYAHRIIEYRKDLIPTGEGQEHMFRIGAGNYAEYRIAPWESGTHEQPLELVSNVDHTIWLDFGGSDTGMVKDIRISAADDGRVFFHETTVGSGFQALFLPGRAVQCERAVLSVDGSGPLPSRPVVAVARGAEPARFDLGRDRRLSINHLFPDRDPDNVNVACPVLRSARALQMRWPQIIADVPVHWNVRLFGDFRAAGSEWRVRAVDEHARDRVLEREDGTDALALEGLNNYPISLMLVQDSASESHMRLNLTAIEFCAVPQAQ